MTPRAAVIGHRFKVYREDKDNIYTEREDCELRALEIYAAVSVYVYRSIDRSLSSPREGSGLNVNYIDDRVTIASNFFRFGLRKMKKFGTLRTETSVSLR